MSTRARAAGTGQTYHRRVKLTRVSLVVAVCVAATACSPGGSEPTDTGPDTVTVTFSSSTSNAPSTTTITPSGGSTQSDTPPASPSPGQPAPTSTRGAPDTTAAPATDDDRSLPRGTRAYADGFVRAWGAGDRDKAGRYATSATVSDLFGVSALGGTSWQRRSSTVEGARTRVRYSNSSGRSLAVLVDEAAASSGRQHAVVGADLGPAPTSTPTETPTDAVGLPRSVTDYADALLADFDGYRGWIAEEHDGRPVGCVLAHRVRKLPTLGHVGRPEWWYVQQVFVSTDRRREGVGRRLLHAVQEAATAERIRWVRLNSSDAGRPLFDAVGFTGPVDRLREWVPPKA